MATICNNISRHRIPRIPQHGRGRHGAGKLVPVRHGYRIGKKTYKSLTAAAKAVTGYKAVSGPAFFGRDAASRSEAR